jgi:hypothetical protein
MQMGPPIGGSTCWWTKLPLGLGEQADWTLICHVGDHIHEVSWLDGDLRAAKISMVTMQP